MSDIITAHYDSPTAVTNAVDDLVGIGIPNEEIRVDKAKHQVQVMIAAVTHAEIIEVLQRHDPTDLETKAVGN